MKKRILKCECPDKASVSLEREYQYSEEEKAGMNHEPNQCKGTFKLKKYKRGGKILTLCSCCNSWGDVEVE